MRYRFVDRLSTLGIHGVFLGVNK